MALIATGVQPSPIQSSFVDSVTEGRAKSLGLEFCFWFEKPVNANRRVLGIDMY